MVQGDKNILLKFNRSGSLDRLPSCHVELNLLMDIQYYASVMPASRWKDGAKCHGARSSDCNWEASCVWLLLLLPRFGMLVFLYMLAAVCLGEQNHFIAGFWCCSTFFAVLFHKMGSGHVHFIKLLISTGSFLVLFFPPIGMWGGGACSSKIY